MLSRVGRVRLFATLWTIVFSVHGFLQTRILTVLFFISLMTLDIEHLSIHVLTSHVYTFFGENSFQVLWPFLN